MIFRMRPGRRPLAALSALCMLAVTSCGAVGTGGGSGHYAALMRTAIGIYEGSDVRILGVAVGKVDQIVPEGDQVRVSFHVDDDTPLPADVKAAVVAPTVVADRYLQLTPPYIDGPRFAENGVIPRERTASPPEFDDLLASAQKLSLSLGPRGVNANGALSEAITITARNLENNGARLNTTLDNTSRAITTLSASRDNLDRTTRNLQSFTTNLKADDAQIRAFTQQFAEVNGFLADERQDLGDTLKELSHALGDVAKFVHDNRDAVKENATQLGSVLETINNERLALEQVLEVAPQGLDGLVNTYDAAMAGLETRSDLLGTLLCMLYSELPTAALKGTFALAVGTAFPNAGAFPNTCTPAASMSLSPEMKAKLADPKLLAQVTATLRQHGAQLPDLAPTTAASRGAGPTAPLSGGRQPALPGLPPATDKNLGSLLGGGR